MFYFARSFLIPYIIQNKYRFICEIGASHGYTTDKLLEIEDLVVTVIDPCLDTDLLTKFKNNPRVRIHKGLSLNVLEELSDQFDCILIDGDHNWYTVFNELRKIQDRNMIKQEGTIILHDVTWPYGRRDMYYQPETVPQEFKHPYAKMGILYGKSALDTAGINSHHHNALYSGGPKNGILTAIEDFLKFSEQNYNFFYIKLQNGLGFLYRKKGSFCSVSYYKLLLKTICFYNPYTTLKNVIRSQSPGLYASLKLLRDAIHRKLT